MKTVREILMEIRQENDGVLTPEIVLERARAEDHPLHNRFVWDDEKAAERYRRSQAHQLIRSVKITYVKRDGGVDTIRAFQAVRQPSGFVYEPTEDVAHNDVLSRIILQEMQRDWLLMRKRWESYREFWEMVSADTESNGNTDVA
jgi:hypothetical protein